MFGKNLTSKNNNNKVYENEENCLKTQFCLCIDNFEQQFGTSLLITRIGLQSFVNNMKSIHPFEKQQTKSFRDFRIFEYDLWQKNKNPETPEIN